MAQRRIRQQAFEPVFFSAEQGSMQSAVCCAAHVAQTQHAGVNVFHARLSGQLRSFTTFPVFSSYVTRTPTLSLKDNSAAPGQHKYSLSSN
jgi:hypothetical protein